MSMGNDGGTGRVTYQVLETWGKMKDGKTQSMLTCCREWRETTRNSQGQGERDSGFEKPGQDVHRKVSLRAGTPITVQRLSRTG